jgi:polysaccharide deacetylase 2 family uncharacterized protein YibQ
MKPLAAYAYPFNQADKRPRIAVVLRDIGPQAGPLAAALKRLPGMVGIALAATTPELDKVMAATRAAGHETLLEIGMEGVDNQSYDPGPNALRRNLTVEENLTRLHNLMQGASGYIGLMLPANTSILDNTMLADALLDEGRSKGLLWLAPGEGMGAFAEAGKNLKAPVLSEQLTRIDDELTPSAIDAALLQIESLARLKGTMVVISAPYPIILERLNRWLPTLEGKGLALAPVSALTPTE